MKKIKFLYFIAILFAFASCVNSGDEAETGDAQDVVEAGNAVDYKLDLAASTISWQGSKPTGKHTGTIKITEGTVQVKDGEIVGGKFVFDMKSIVSNDMPDAEMRTKLEGHLKSPDFFSVDSFPTASFVITKVAVDQAVPANRNITGNLTIKGIEKSITFSSAVSVSETEVKATAPMFSIDRTEWKVIYNSGKFFPSIADKVINDEIGIEMKIVAKK